MFQPILPGEYPEISLLPPAIAEYLAEDDPYRMGEPSILDHFYHAPAACVFRCAGTEGELYLTACEHEETRTVPCDARNGTLTARIDNLYTGEHYRWEIRTGETVLSSGTFRTKREPRLIRLEHVNNVRDLGGKKTADGRILREGLLYRSSQMGYNDICYITDEGRQTLRDVLHVKTIIDFRKEIEDSDLRAERAGKEFTHLFLPLEGYNFTDTDPIALPYFAQTMEVLTDPANYPILYHCAGGADRTGTFSFLLCAMLGVPLPDLIRDYELTSFGNNYFRDKNRKNGYPYWKTIASYRGETLRESARNFLRERLFVTDTCMEKIEKLLLS